VKGAATSHAGALAALLCAATAPVATAQEWFGVATWQVSFPTGDTQTFTDEVSFRGVGLDFRRTLRGGTAANVMMAWNVFHERTDGTLEIESGAVTGSQDRYINSLPVMVGLHQYFGSRRSTRVHVGVNGGGYVLVQTFRIGVAEFEEDTWEWGLAPEAGVTVPIQTAAWFEVNARYQWSPTPSSLTGNDVDLTYFQINVGFMWEQ
jgi:hypothetical protein